MAHAGRPSIPLPPRLLAPIRARCAGTYRATHPKIQPIDPREYNWRPVRLAAKMVAARWGAPPTPA